VSIGIAGSPATGRLLFSGPGAAAENMAIDGAVLAGTGPDSGPTLRFYSWSSPTLSLGYFQPYQQRGEHAESSRLPIVRRATGGGAIVHDRELTYSLIVPASQRWVGAAPALYRAVHDAFVAALAEFGVTAIRFADSFRHAPAGEPFLCFQRRTDEDLLVNQYKVLGSAQRRGPGGLLQHGSLLLAASSAAPQLPGIAELTGRVITAAEISSALAEKLTALLKVQWQEAGLSSEERAAALAIQEQKFAAPAWTQRR